ncbi:MAG: hypothetical protein HY914_10080 [Desulfomonile tiedjei]|nr:hypothetical protein [Desulfomonile tiedjei]
MAGSRRKSKKQLELSSVLSEEDQARRARQLFEAQRNTLQNDARAYKWSVSPQVIKTGAPFSDIFPINSGTRQAIQEHIRDHGFDEAYPLILGTGPWTDEPMLLDGHTRLKAAIAVGCESVPVVIKEFATEDEALEYAIHNQRDRRNLTDADIARLVAIVDERRKPEFHGNQHTGGQAQHCATPKPSKSAEQTAETLGISPRKVEQTRTVLDHAPEETKQEVLAGTKTIHRAYQETQKQRRDGGTAKPSREDTSQPETALPRVDAKAEDPAMREPKRELCERIRFLEKAIAYDREHVAQRVEEEIGSERYLLEVKEQKVWEERKRFKELVAASDRILTIPDDPGEAALLIVAGRDDQWLRTLCDRIEEHIRASEPIQDEGQQTEPSTETPPDQPESKRPGPKSEWVEQRLQLLGCQACAGFRRTGKEALCNWPKRKGMEPLDFTGPAFDCPKAEAQAPGGAPF